MPCLLALGGGLLLCPAWDALEGLLVAGGELAWEELFSSLAVVGLGGGERRQLPREGVCLLGDNCFLPREEGEQLPVLG